MSMVYSVNYVSPQSRTFLLQGLQRGLEFKHKVGPGECPGSVLHELGAHRKYRHKPYFQHLHRQLLRGKTKGWNQR